jgi:ribosomal protein S18 acetylase RimI-like enzyme
MEVTGPVAGPQSEGAKIGWLRREELPEVTALIDEEFPRSYARPGGSGVHRWAGLRGDDGQLLAVAAEAWSTPGTGFLAGVATRTQARGRGLARQVCAFATNEQITGRARVALLADYWNVAAVAAYRKLGFALRPLAAAHLI